MVIIEKKIKIHEKSIKEQLLKVLKNVKFSNFPKYVCAVKLSKSWSEKEKNRHRIHTWPDNAFQGTVVNRVQFL